MALGALFCGLLPDTKVFFGAVWLIMIGVLIEYDDRGGIWTTLAAMNAAVGVAQETKSETYSTDMVV